jgi:hypothetical protein
MNFFIGQMGGLLVDRSERRVHLTVRGNHFLLGCVSALANQGEPLDPRSKEPLPRISSGSTRFRSKCIRCLHYSFITETQTKITHMSAAQWKINFLVRVAKRTLARTTFLNTLTARWGYYLGPTTWQIDALCASCTGDRTVSSPT